MKFDVVIGNPPYQMNDGGHGSSATAIYGDFFLNAKKLKPSYISMIMPSRWMTGGKGLDDFREEMISDKHIRILHDYMNSADCFNSVQIEGGVCHFIWDKNNEGPCNFYTHSSGKEICVERYLSEGNSDVVVRDANAIKILKKVKTYKENSFSDIVLPRNPFGINENELPFSTIETNLKIFGRFDRTRSIKYLKENYLISKNKNLFTSWKVFISKADGAAGQLGNPIPAKIIGKAELGDKNTICTETFLAIAPFKSQLEAKNTIKYMETKFFRFMVGMRKLKNMTRDTYQFVPVQNFSSSSSIDWNKSIHEIDLQLYKKYGLTREEIDFIETMIRPME